MSRAAAAGKDLGSGSPLTDAFADVSAALTSGSSLTSRRTSIARGLADAAVLLRSAGVGAVPAQADAVLRALLASPLALVTPPIARSLGDAYVALLDASPPSAAAAAAISLVAFLLRHAASSAALHASRCAALGVLCDVAAAHGRALAPSASETCAALMRVSLAPRGAVLQLDAAGATAPEAPGGVAVRVAASVALYRFLEACSVEAGDGGGANAVHPPVRGGSNASAVDSGAHLLAILRHVSSCTAVDPAPSVRQCLGPILQALACASGGFTRVPLDACLSLATGALGDPHGGVRLGAALALASILAHSVSATRAAARAREVSSAGRVSARNDTVGGGGGGDGDGGGRGDGEGGATGSGAFGDFAGSGAATAVGGGDDDDDDEGGGGREGVDGREGVGGDGDGSGGEGVDVDAVRSGNASASSASGAGGARGKVGPSSLIARINASLRVGGGGPPSGASSVDASATLDGTGGANPVAMSAAAASALSSSVADLASPRAKGRGGAIARAFAASFRTASGGGGGLLGSSFSPASTSSGGARGFATPAACAFLLSLLSNAGRFASKHGIRAADVRCAVAIAGAAMLKQLRGAAGGMPDTEVGEIVSICAAALRTSGGSGGLLLLGSAPPVSNEPLHLLAQVSCAAGGGLPVGGVHTAHARACVSHMLWEGLAAAPPAPLALHLDGWMRWVYLLFSETTTLLSRSCGLSPSSSASGAGGTSAAGDGSDGSKALTPSSPSRVSGGSVAASRAPNLRAGSILSRKQQKESLSRGIAEGAVGSVDGVGLSPSAACFLLDTAAHLLPRAAVLGGRKCVASARALTAPAQALLSSPSHDVRLCAARALCEACHVAPILRRSHLTSCLEGAHRAYAALSLHDVRAAIEAQAAAASLGDAHAYASQRRGVMLAASSSSSGSSGGNGSGSSGVSGNGLGGNLVLSHSGTSPEAGSAGGFGIPGAGPGSGCGVVTGDAAMRLQQLHGFTAGASALLAAIGKEVDDSGALQPPDSALLEDAIALAALLLSAVRGGAGLPTAHSIMLAPPGAAAAAAASHASPAASSAAAANALAHAASAAARAEIEAGFTRAACDLLSAVACAGVAWLAHGDGARWAAIHTLISRGLLRARRDAEAAGVGCGRDGTGVYLYCPLGVPPPVLAATSLFLASIAGGAGGSSVGLGGLDTSVGTLLEGAEPTGIATARSAYCGIACAWAHSSFAALCSSLCAVVRVCGGAAAAGRPALLGQLVRLVHLGLMTNMEVPVVPTAALSALGGNGSSSHARSGAVSSLMRGRAGDVALAVGQATALRTHAGAAVALGPNLGMHPAKLPRGLPVQAVVVGSGDTSTAASSSGAGGGSSAPLLVRGVPYTPDFCAWLYSMNGVSLAACALTRRSTMHVTASLLEAAALLPHQSTTFAMSLRKLVLSASMAVLSGGALAVEPLEMGLFSMPPPASHAAFSAVRALDAVLDGTFTRGDSSSSPRGPSLSLPRPVPGVSESASADLAVVGMLAAAGEYEAAGGASWSPLSCSLSLAAPPAAPPHLWGSVGLHAEDTCALLTPRECAEEGACDTPPVEGGVTLSTLSGTTVLDGGWARVTSALDADLYRGGNIPSPPKVPIAPSPDSDWGLLNAAGGLTVLGGNNTPSSLSALIHTLESSQASGASVVPLKAGDGALSSAIATALLTSNVPPALPSLAQCLSSEATRLSASPFHTPMDDTTASSTSPSARAAAAAVSCIASSLPLLPLGSSLSFVSALAALLRLPLRHQRVTPGGEMGAFGLGGDDEGVDGGGAGGLSSSSGFRLVGGTAVTVPEASTIATNAAVSLLAVLVPLRPEHVSGAAAAAAAGLPSGDFGSVGGGLVPWVLALRAALGIGIVSPLPLVRRVSCCAIGQLARVGGAAMTRKLLLALQKRLRVVISPKQQQQQSGASDAAAAGPPLPPTARAGIALAIASIRRVASATLAQSLTIGRVVQQQQQHSAGSVALAAAARLLDPAPLSSPSFDGVDPSTALLFDAAKETRAPVRSWALHGWLLLLRGSLQVAHAAVHAASPVAAASPTSLKTPISLPPEALASLAALRGMVAPTLALLEAHAQRAAGEEPISTADAVNSESRVSLSGMGGAVATLSIAASTPPLGVVPLDHSSTGVFSTAAGGGSSLPGGGGIAYGERMGGVAALGDACDATLRLLHLGKGPVAPLLLFPCYDPSTLEVLPSPAIITATLAAAAASAAATTTVSSSEAGGSGDTTHHSTAGTSSSNGGAGAVSSAPRGDMQHHSSSQDHLSHAPQHHTHEEASRSAGGAPAPIGGRSLALTYKAHLKAAASVGGASSARAFAAAVVAGLEGERSLGGEGALGLYREGGGEGDLTLSLARILETLSSALALLAPAWEQLHSTRKSSNKSEGSGSSGEGGGGGGVDAMAALDSEDTVSSGGAVVSSESFSTGAPPIPHQLLIHTLRTAQTLSSLASDAVSGASAPVTARIAWCLVQVCGNLAKLAATGDAEGARDTPLSALHEGLTRAVAVGAGLSSGDGVSGEACPGVPLPPPLPSHACSHLPSLIIAHTHAALEKLGVRWVPTSASTALACQSPMTGTLRARSRSLMCITSGVYASSIPCVGSTGGSEGGSAFSSVAAPLGRWAVGGTPLPTPAWSGISALQLASGGAAHAQSPKLLCLTSITNSWTTTRVSSTASTSDSTLVSLIALDAALHAASLDTRQAGGGGGPSSTTPIKAALANTVRQFVSKTPRSNDVITALSHSLDATVSMTLTLMCAPGGLSPYGRAVLAEVLACELYAFGAGRKSAPHATTAGRAGVRLPRPPTPLSRAVIATLNRVLEGACSALRDEHGAVDESVTAASAAAAAAAVSASHHYSEEAVTPPPRASLIDSRASILATASLRLLEALLTATENDADPDVPSSHLFVQHSAILATALLPCLQQSAPSAEADAAAVVVRIAVSCGAIDDGAAVRRLCTAAATPSASGRGRGVLVRSLWVWAAALPTPRGAAADAVLSSLSAALPLIPAAWTALTARSRLLPPWKCMETAVSTISGGGRFAHVAQGGGSAAAAREVGLMGTALVEWALDGCPAVSTTTAAAADEGGVGSRLKSVPLYASAALHAATTALCGSLSGGRLCTPAHILVCGSRFVESLHAALAAEAMDAPALASALSLLRVAAATLTAGGGGDARTLAALIVRLAKGAPREWGAALAHMAPSEREALEGALRGAAAAGFAPAVGNAPPPVTAVGGAPPPAAVTSEASPPGRPAGGLFKGFSAARFAVAAATTTAPVAPRVPSAFEAFLAAKDAFSSRGGIKAREEDEEEGVGEEKTASDEEGEEEEEGVGDEAEEEKGVD